MTHPTYRTYSTSAAAAAALVLLLFVSNASTAHAGAVTKPQPTTRTVFKSSGTFNVPRNVSNVDVLVVAGGGGGASFSGAGGGAGGFVYKPSFRVTPGSSISVTVGDGGVGAGANLGPGTNGATSTFATISASGGGGGGGSSAGANQAGRAGGSGGGGEGYAGGAVGGAGNVVSTSPSQGNNGGTGSAAGNGAGGGGGGASTVGANATTNTGGNGGAGTVSTISGSSVTYAGGGGGSGLPTAGTGGAGGGANGSNSENTGATAPAGTANTGGGGGGGYNDAGGTGGSGVVVVAYNNPDPYWRNVVLLAGNNNGTASSTTFIDQSTSRHKLSASGNAQWDALYAPTGLGSSVLFDGSGDLLSVSNDTSLNLTTPFTFEAWVYITDSTHENDIVNRTNNNSYFALVINTTTRKLQSVVGNGSAWFVNHTSASAISLNTWTHIAFSWDGTTYRSFINGTKDGETTSSTAPSNPATALLIGSFTTRYYQGNIASVRLTNGVARYTANFTPPTLGLPVTISSSKVAAASTTPGIINATGGTISTVVQNNVTYKVHTFTSSGTFTVTKGSSKVWYLVVAGGGGGGNNAAGGGGAGGYRSNAGYNYAVSPGLYTVTVGGGGAADTNGSDSVFGTITSTGGGSGKGYNGQSGAAGGSGGGGGTANSPTPLGTGGAGTAGQGNDGGIGLQWPSYNAGGGGGGAGAVGGTAVAGGTGGAGGAGTASTISGTSVTYAGGGGGGGVTTAGAAGSGGGGLGGVGGSGGNGVDGTANTGGGAGGASNGATGGAGGSGIVIIRYPLSAVTQSNTSQNAKVTSGLVGLWSFDGPDIAGVTAYDRSGSGNNGTLTNGPTRTAGKLGQGLKFDGVDDYVNVTNVSGALDIGGNYLTISFWLKAGATTGYYETLIAKRVAGTGTANYQTYLNTVTRALGYYDGTTAVNTTFVPTVGKWYHIVITVDKTATPKTTFYVDGTQYSTGASTIGSTNAGLLYLGNFDNATDEPFNGSIDDVRIYNRALSAQEVKLLYNNGR
ncbi:MAG: LamG domain-containing protein [Patescibacteria group bacterium]